jgi:hypothetical protein
MREVKPAFQSPCKTCPWRRENQGKPTPEGWYSDENLERMWDELRRGRRMTCHATDPDVYAAPHERPSSLGDHTHECAGALVLQQRELVLLDDLIQSDPTSPGLTTYLKKRPDGLTVSGVAALMDRYLFGGIVAGDTAMSTPCLGGDIYYHKLGPWEGPQDDSESEG